ncbi:TonB-dependent siderophore receptor [Corticibacter populi]|uniref:TonB-dependent siderophore receptor n=1 Tax=Corticibacter populi TaxID=1550736 RepID=A0A3M6R1C9_9BURK|nr:TonB-dependent siderophore receptor [Corticibacter populi]RMX08709.1 TonB-dependent siderophore receptor [Corticibacter populi]RZS36058.1 iron complex outermembrane receptor protein [Corticibacter populi]
MPPLFRHTLIAFTTASIWPAVQAQTSLPAAASGHAAIELPEIVVTAQEPGATDDVPGYVARKSTAGSKTDASLLEIPQTINVITAQEIAERGNARLSETLRYTPGVVTEVQTSSSYFDRLRIRGFYSINNIYLNNMQMSGTGTLAVAQVDPTHLSRVEVIKGPASALYGQTGTGGLVDMQLKRPQAEAPHRIGLGLGNKGQRELNLDWGGQLAGQDTLLFRVTGVARRSEMDAASVTPKRYSVVPSVLWAPNGVTKVYSYVGLQRDEGGSSASYLPLVGTLKPSPWGYLSRDFQAGDPSVNDFTRRQAFAGTELTHDLNDQLQYQGNFRYAWVDADVDFLSPGAFTGASQTVSRTFYQQAATSRAASADNHLRYRFGTGLVRHEVVAGLDWRRFSSDNQTSTAATSPVFNLFAPTYGKLTLGTLALRTNSSSTLTQTGIYVQDQASIGPWRIMAGLRRDWSRSSTDNLVTGASTTQKDIATSGRVGLTYLMDGGVAPYVSYSRSFEPASGTDYFGTAFKPTVGTQWEVGVKYAPTQWRGFLTASVYDLKRSNVSTSDLDHTCDAAPQLADCGSYSVQSGEVSVKGLELEGKVDLNRNWSATAGYAWMKARYSRDNAGLQGKTPSNTPSQMASLWLSHRWNSGALAGLSASAGVRRVGAMWAEDANTNRIPAYALWDAMFSYDLGAASSSMRGWNVRLNISNLADKQAVGGCWSANYCDYVQGRRVSASVNMEF